MGLDQKLRHIAECPAFAEIMLTASAHNFPHFLTRPMNLIFETTSFFFKLRNEETTQSNVKQR